MSRKTRARKKVGPTPEELANRQANQMSDQVQSELDAAAAEHERIMKPGRVVEHLSFAEKARRRQLKTSTKKTTRTK